MRPSPSVGNRVEQLRRFGSLSVCLLALLVSSTALVKAGTVQEKLAEVRRSANFERSYADLVEAVTPAVVFVEVERKTAEVGDMPQIPEEMRRFFRRFFGPDFPFPEGRPTPPRGPRGEAVGSGFIVSPEGHVVTNAHVARDAAKITVSLQDGRKLVAEVVGLDDKTDLAVLKLPGGGPYPYVEFGDSDRVRVGDKVIAVGNPFGLGGTVTAGIVSATRREIGVGPYDDFLQIDAPINRGNSGGPTFDLDGYVIGVNTLIFSPSGGNVGIGFAIAANLAKDVVRALIEKGEVERGWLGVIIQAVDEDIAQALGLEQAKGALVSSVQANSPAARAGIRPGDVILAFNGKEVSSPRELARLVAGAGPGRQAELTLVRDGQQQTVRLELGTMPAGEMVAQAPEPASAKDRLGLAVRPLTPDDRRELGLAADIAGVLVVSVEQGSPAAEKGIQAGDVIAEVDGRAVRSATDVRKAVAAAAEAGKKAVLLRIIRENQPRFVAVPVGKEQG